MTLVWVKLEILSTESETIPKFEYLNGRNDRGGFRGFLATEATEGTERTENGGQKGI